MASLCPLNPLIIIGRGILVLVNEFTRLRTVWVNRFSDVPKMILHLMLTCYLRVLHASLVDRGYRRACHFERISLCSLELDYPKLSSHQFLLPPPPPPASIDWWTVLPGQPGRPACVSDGLERRTVSPCGEIFPPILDVTAIPVAWC